MQAASGLPTLRLTLTLRPAARADLLSAFSNTCSFLACPNFGSQEEMW
jgi:hypothetical protein